MISFIKICLSPVYGYAFYNILYYKECNRNLTPKWDLYTHIINVVKVKKFVLSRFCDITIFFCYGYDCRNKFS